MCITSIERKQQSMPLNFEENKMVKNIHMYIKKSEEIFEYKRKIKVRRGKSKTRKK